MSELVVEPLELVNVGHDHGHASTVAARALDLLENAQLKKAPVEDSGQAIEIGQLLHPLNIMCILDGGGANVGHGFETLQFALAEGVAIRAFERQHSQDLPEGNQRYAHARRRFYKEPHALGLGGKVLLDERSAGRENMRPGLAIRRKSPAFGNPRGQSSVVRPQYQFAFFAKK